jgi:hypothetical protein
MVGSDSGYSFTCYEVLDSDTWLKLSQCHATVMSHNPQIERRSKSLWSFPFQAPSAFVARLFISFWIEPWVVA